MTHAYLFEAKSIQSYIFATNKLKEIIGGSELIENLTEKNGLLFNVLDALKLTYGDSDTVDIRLSRCGGAAFYAFSENSDAIQKLASLWPLVFRQYAPDMEFIHAKAEAAKSIEAFQKAHKCLMTDRNRPNAKLPQASVYALRFPRTGEPASQALRMGGKSELIDSVTARKRQFDEGAALIQRVMAESGSENWPVNLTPEEDEQGRNFPFEGDSRLIGLVHADGNGFGQLLMNLKKVVDDENSEVITNENYIAVFRDISESIKAVTEAATKHAVAEVLEPNRVSGLYPARPIVLGGDDLTMIVRADLALPFTTAFLNAFETESSKQFDALRGKHQGLKDILPEKLTACAGIVYAKSSQPFSALHDLAEGLCKYAKSIAKQDDNQQQDIYGKKQVPSSLSFYRVTSTLLDGFDDIRTQELTAGNTTLSRGCYTLDEKHQHIPKLSDLLELQRFLSKSEISQGALRQVLGLLHQSPQQAQNRYRRWREVMQERDEKEDKHDWERFHSLLKKLSQFVDATDFDTSETQEVPFEDLLSLSAVGNKPDAEKGEEQ